MSKAATLRERPKKGAVAAAPPSKSRSPVTLASRSGGPSDVEKWIDWVHGASSLQLIDLERKGVDSRLVKSLAKSLQLPASRVFEILGVPKATAEKKASAGEPLVGSGGYAALGIIRLLAMAEEIIENTMSDAATDFDVGKWLGEWLETVQPALAGRKPSDVLGTPTGLHVVMRILGGLQSGAYQ